MSVDYISNLAMVTSAALYLLALIAYAAKWASGRALLTEGVKPSRAQVDADEKARFGLDLWGRIGIALACLGLATHLVGVIGRGIAANRAPWGNMYEFITSALVAVVALFVYLAIAKGADWLGLPVMLLAALGQGLAVTVFYVAVGPLVPALHSVFFVVHILAAITAAGAFNIGAIAAILYLLKARAEKRGPVKGYLAKLPSAEVLDRFSYRATLFGFPIWTFTIAAGAVWAQYAWGRFWGWDPKETWSFITWVVYAGYLHARLTAGWKGRRAAIVSIIGVATFWFNFVGINLLVSGLHSYGKG